MLNDSIILMQTPSSRAINLGYLKMKSSKLQFVPARLNLGPQREHHTHLATIESLNLSEIKKILKKYPERKISAITILREGLACRLGDALLKVGKKKFYGDVFVGVSHQKDKGKIISTHYYENIEGLSEKGLWIIAESICMGRNLYSSLKSLFKKNSPKEIIFICPIASKIGILKIIKLLKKNKIPFTFVVWGALFGVSEENWYDMPWGHKNTMAKDLRDKDVFVKMYGEKLCVAGDFGNNYYAPYIAEKVYLDQLKEHKITPDIPSAEEILRIYKKEELLRWDK